MRKIAIANNKGGVAKTTTVYNLASYYAKNGFKVLVVDMDPQGNMTSGLGANLNLASQVSRETLLKKSLKDVEDDFDICLIDTSPSLSVLTFNALAAADSIYIPLRAGYFELRGAGMLIDTIEQLKDELNSSLKINGIILTQYDIRSNLSSDTQNELENYFGSSLMKSKIRQNVDLGKAPALAQDIFTFAPHSNGAKDYEFLALEILEREGLNTNG